MTTGRGLDSGLHGTEADLIVGHLDVDMCEPDRFEPTAKGVGVDRYEDVVDVEHADRLGVDRVGADEGAG